MSTMVSPEVDEHVDLDNPRVLIVLDDPVNLISYVAATFMSVFGWDRDTAMRHTMEVHLDGRSAVYTGPRKQAETFSTQLRAAGLWTKIADS